MIIFREFNEEEKIDRIWYQSSMIVYSECQDKEGTPLKDVKVVFKNGSSYLYKDINVNDYVSFVHGGLDGSNGKALNKFIKPTCSEYKRLEDVNLAELQAIMEDKMTAMKKTENKTEDGEDENTQKNGCDEQCECHPNETCEERSKN